MKTKIALALLLLLSPTFALADENSDKATQGLAVGKTFEPYTLEDQHEAKHTLGADTRHVILSGNMELSKEFHAWLNEQDPNYLPLLKTEYVADITEMPSIITWLFAGPKMRKYPFQILLAKDENFAPKYSVSEDEILVVDLDNNKVITAMTYYKTTTALENRLEEIQAQMNPMPGTGGRNMASPEL